MRPFAIPLWLLASVAGAAIPSPSEFLGIRVGADRVLADYRQVATYFKALDAASPRLEIEVLGKTTLGEDMFMAVISSEGNVRNLARIREVARRLADPRGLSEAEAAGFVREGKVVLLITCNIHSTEIGASQMAMEWAHALTTAEDAETKRRLENVVLLLVPSLNPDGQIMETEWYRKNLGTRYEGSRMPWLYHHYVGHDNNRDWFMLTQKETRALSRAVYKRWFPQIWLDEHQMGAVGPRIFVPPYAEPVSPVIHPLVWREVNLIGSAMTALITSAGVHRADAAEQTRAETSVRLVRSQSGTRGTQQANRYVIEDPRSVFSTIDDRQVVVLFEWEAQPGLHHCVARWKDPSGKVVLVTPVDYQSTSRRFSIYWTLALPERMARGLWALEASVDGTPAGTHTFEVTDLPAPSLSLSPSPSPSPSPAKPLLSQAEIHQRAIASIGILERLGPAGERLGGGPAVALDGDHLVTAFPSIEGATTLRLGTVPGHRVESREIGEWDRRQGWAVLRFPGHGLAAPPRRSGALVIGARCYVLDSTEDGAWVITEAGVVGEEAPPVGRPRLSMGFAAGSPVFDEYGDLAGIVAGPSGKEELGPRSVAVLRGMNVPRGILVVPADWLPMVPTARTRLAELGTGGQLPPLSPEQQHVSSGVFAGRVQRRGPAPIPLDQRSVFSRRDGQVSVFIQWSPQRRMEALSRFNLYDANHRLRVRGEASKLELRRGEPFVSSWTVGISALPAGMYRVDLLLDEAPVWRGYLRITD